MFRINKKLNEELRKMLETFHCEIVYYEIGYYNIGLL